MSKTVLLVCLAIYAICASAGCPPNASPLAMRGSSLSGSCLDTNFKQGGDGLVYDLNGDTYCHCDRGFRCNGPACNCLVGGTSAFTTGQLYKLQSTCEEHASLNFTEPPPQRTIAERPGVMASCNWGPIQMPLYKYFWACCGTFTRASFYANLTIQSVAKDDYIVRIGYTDRGLSSCNGGTWYTSDWLPGFESKYYRNYEDNFNHTESPALGVPLRTYTAVIGIQCANPISTCQLQRWAANLWE